MNKYIPWFEIVACLAAWIALPRFKSRPQLWVFPPLLTLVAGIETYQTFFRTAPSVNNAWVYNLMEPLVWGAYITSLYLAFQSKANRKWLIALVVAYLSVAAITMPQYLQEQRFNVVLVAVGSVFMSAMIMVKFYELLKSPQGFNFLRDPYFYILFMLLLFTAGTLPYFVMGNWLYYTMDRADLVQVLANVMSILNYMLYTTYTVCFVWIRAKKDSY